MNIKEFLEIYKKNANTKNIEELIGDILVLKLSFREDFIAFTRHANNAILINEENLNLINEDYVLLHEYFHMIQNESYPLKKEVLNIGVITDLEWADLFAAKFLIEKGELSKVPKNVLKLILEKKQEFGIKNVD